MERVFFSGSISTKALPQRIMASIDSIYHDGGYEVLVGDASGFDFLLQQYCEQIGFNNVTVYCINQIPRNYIKHFKHITVAVSDSVRGERKRQTFKDEKMTLDSGISFVIWDEKSTGSYNNILRALRNNRKTRVYSTKVDQPIKNVTKENISNIYQNSNGLTASDLLTNLFENGVKEFDNVKQLNLYLVEYKHILKVSETNKHTYKTINDSLSFDIFHRGKPSGVRFKPELVKLLIKKFKPINNSSGYAGMRG